MTGGNTDSVKVPHYQAAVAALLRIASSLFKEALYAMASDRGPSDPILGSWLFCRQTADAFLARQHTVLLPDDEKRLDRAFELAKKIAFMVRVGEPQNEAQTRLSRVSEDILKYRLAVHDDKNEIGSAVVA